ncbi:MAG: hypothetical protein V1720_09800 [bacterium]
MKNSVIYSFILLFLFGITQIFAQNFNDALRLSEPGFGSNARALGMGNSYVAISDDYSGTIFNPAGLGLVKRMEISGTMDFNSFENNTTFFKNETNYSNSTTSMNQFGCVFPMPTIQGSLVFGLGFNQLKNFNRVTKFDGFNPSSSMINNLTGMNDDIIYDLYLSYNNGGDDQTVIDGNLNQSGTKLEEGSLNSWAFSGSVEMAENLFVGATLNILSGDYKSDREYYEDDTKDFYGSSVLTDPSEQRTADFQYFFMNDIIDWNLSGWDFKMGFLYRLPLRGAIGATIKFPSDFTIEEKYFVDASSYFGSGNEFYINPVEDEVEYEISTPYQFELGGSFFITSLLLSGQVGFTNYSDMEFTLGLDPDHRSENNRDIKDLFDTAINYNFGLEYTIPYIDLSVRAGYMVRQSPYKVDTSEFDKKYFTGGLGIILNNSTALDFAYVHGSWKDYSDNYGSNQSRVYQDISTDNLIFTFSYRY